jgi:hypothetical protein
MIELGITIFIALVSLLIYYEKNVSDLTYVESKVSGKKYLCRNVKDKQKAADTLGEVHLRLQKLTDHLKSQKQSKGIKNIITRFNPENISESAGGSKYTSYSVNKGEKIVFCIRTKDPQEKLIDINTIMFVAIHELAHLMSDTIGHTSEFWTNMKFLLKHGIDIGVYKYQDYRSNPKPYCGITITDTPLD